MSAAQDDVRHDLRSQLEAAFRGQRENEEPEEVEAEDVEAEVEASDDEAPARDEKGRFAAKDAEEPEDVEASEEAEDEPEKPAMAPPNGWTAEAKAKWAELPEEVRQAALKREEDIAKFASRSDDERNFGREMYRAVQPYMAQIQAEGGTPVSAVQSLLNTAYVLRSGTAEQKRQMILTVAREYGVDLSASQTTEPGPLSSALDPVMQRISNLESTLTRRQQEEQQRLQYEIQSELDAFASNPEHPHFEEVKVHMAALLREGAAKDLKDAYEQACWARSDIRTSLLAQQRAEDEQKRKSEAKRKAEKAKRNSVSITGGPGNVSAKSAPEHRSLREELEAQFSAQVGAV